MFVHLGGSHMIRAREVIVILAAGELNMAQSKHAFIATAYRKGLVEEISSEEIKSYIVTDYKVYASPISSITLKKRASTHSIIVR